MKSYFIARPVRIRENSRDCVEVRSLRSPFPEPEKGGSKFPINKVRAFRTFSTPLFILPSPLTPLFSRRKPHSLRRAPSLIRMETKESPFYDKSGPMAVLHSPQGYRDSIFPLRCHCWSCGHMLLNINSYENSTTQ